MIIQLDVRCSTCRHRTHSGAFTPGGAKDVCGHGSAPESFFPGPGNHRESSREFCRKLNSCKTAAEQDALGQGPDSWVHRVIDISAAEPPAQCPLRKFEVAG